MNLDEFFTLTENPQKTNVILTVKKDIYKEYHKTCDLSFLIQYLRNKKYFYRIIKSNLIKLIYMKFQSEPLIAVRSDMLFFKRTELAFSMNDEWVCLKDKKTLKKNVKKDELLVRIRPKEGVYQIRNVYGSKMIIENFDINDFLGKNVRYEKENHEYRIFSDIDGLFTIAYDLLNVYPDLIIEDDININYGNVYTEGNLKVKGDIFSTLKIRAEGDIFLHGVVECAEIYGNGNVFLEKNASGFQKGKIVSKKNIYLKSAQNFQIISHEDIFVKSSLTHCKTYALGKFIMEKGGRLSGGIVNAKKGAVLGTVGSPEAVSTEILTGVDPLLLNTMEKQKERVRTIDREIKLIKKNVEFLKEPNLPLPEYEEPIFYSCFFQEKISLEKEEKEEYIKLSHYFFLLQLLKDEKENIKKKMSVMKKHIFPEEAIEIKVMNKVYPAVLIRIKNHYSLIKEESGEGIYRVTDQGIEKMEMEE